MFYFYFQLVCQCLSIFENEMSNMIITSHGENARQEAKAFLLQHFNLLYW
jgi:hypothetical protein